MPKRARDCGAGLPASEAAFELMRGLWEANEVWAALIEEMLAKHGR